MAFMWESESVYSGQALESKAGPNILEVGFLAVS